MVWDKAIFKQLRVKTVRLHFMGKLVQIFIVLALFYAPPLEALCVSVAKANLRARPSVNSPITWRVGRYMPLLKLSSRGKWYKVQDLEGTKHWVYRRLVSSQMDCVVVKNRFTNLRTGPGTKYKKSAMLFAERYFAFKKLDRDGGWLKVQDDYGMNYWVFDRNVWEPLRYSTIRF